MSSPLRSLEGDVVCLHRGAVQHWAYVVGPERSLRGRILHLHDYPPLSGGGLALTVRELVQESGRPNDHVIAATRLKDHYGDDTRVEAIRFNCEDLINEACAVVLHLTYSPRVTHALMNRMVAENIPFHVVLHCRETHINYGNIADAPRDVRRRALDEINQKLAAASSIRCLCPSQARELSQSLGRQVFAAPLVTVDMGFRAESVKPRQNLIAAGELSLLKGTDRIPALSVALARRIDVYGHGDQLWRDYLQSFKISHHPTLSRRDLAVAIDRSSGVLVPSRSESWSRIGAEALWLGRPVVTATQLGVLEWAESLTGMALGFDVDRRDQSLLDEEFEEFLDGFSSAEGIECITSLNLIAQRHWQQFFVEIVE